MMKFKVYVLSLVMVFMTVVTPGRAIAQTTVLAQAFGVISSVASSGVVTRGVSLLSGPWGSLAALAVGATIAGFYHVGSDGQVANLLPKSVAASQIGVLNSQTTHPPHTWWGCGASQTTAAMVASACASTSTKSCVASGSNEATGSWSIHCTDNSNYSGLAGTDCPTNYSWIGGQCSWVSSSSQPGQLPQTEGYKSPVLVGGQPVLSDLPTSKAVPLVQDKAIPVAGNPNQTIQYTPVADGGIQITTRTYDPATQTTKIETAQVDSTGKVIANSSAIANGNVIGGSVIAVGGDIQFPTDYNRESTQASILDKATQIETEAKTDRDQASTRADQIQTDVTAATAAGGTDASRWTKDGLNLPDKDQFQAPDTSSYSSAIPDDTGCVGIPMTISGHTQNLDVCPMVTAIKPYLNWGIMLMFIIATWNFVLGRRTEAS